MDFGPTIRNLYEFKRLRWLEAGLNTAQAATLLGKSEDTVRRWERTQSAPAWAVNVMKWAAGRLADPAWDGWSVADGRIWTPDGTGVRPGEIQALPYLMDLLREHEKPRQLDFFK